MDYELTGFVASDLVKVDIMVNKTVVDALSIIMHRSVAESRGRKVLERLRKKVTRIREQMRVLESKVNGHKRMTYWDKVEFETPITRLYESLGGLVEFLDGLIEVNT